MTEKPTGPELFRLARQRPTDVNAINANTAALVMLGRLFAASMNMQDADLDGWARVIPPTPLTKCRDKETRRPACAEWHTEDCPYSDPRIPVGARVRHRPSGSSRPGTVTEQKRLASGKYRLRVQWDGAEESWIDQPDVIIVRHEKLPVGTRVVVADSMIKYGDEIEFRDQPWAGKITGYDHSSAYTIVRERGSGNYLDNPEYVCMDERVQIHPEGPKCPPAPEPVKEEPTGPRMYVQNQRGKQGYILRLASQEAKLVAQVRWFTPGAQPVWIHMDTLRIITSEEVERCPHGQTGDECGSGENQCEPCRQAEDEEGDEIERSMGLR